MAVTETRAHQSSPSVPIAQWLGYGGLIPFVVGAALVWLIQPQWRSFTAAALSAYAAVIVSFLGGIHRGIGFRDGTPRLFLWGVVPSLPGGCSRSAPLNPNRERRPPWPLAPRATRESACP